jgi:hypothetical protein
MITICPQLRPCARCRAATVQALTTPPTAWTATTDPVPLNAEQEIAALIGGRMTYDYVTFITSSQLIHRDQFRIVYRDWPVFAEHRCPGPIPWTAIPPPPRTEDVQLHEIPY